MEVQYGLQCLSDAYLKSETGKKFQSVLNHLFAGLRPEIESERSVAIAAPAPLRAAMRTLHGLAGRLPGIYEPHVGARYNGQPQGCSDKRLHGDSKILS